MFSDWVIAHFDIFKDVVARLFAGCINSLFYARAVKQLKEALSHRDVVTIPTPTHRCFEVMTYKKLLLPNAREPRTLIEVDQ